MKVRSKKVLSAAVVSAILAAQTLMPVAAAGGEITANMSTMSPVLRVQVPTKMAVAVNEFEKGDTGSQVSSDEFTMKNLSEVPVNVKVTSEAEVGAAIELVSTKEAAKASTAKDKPAMWLAAAAAVKDNSGTLEYLATGTDKKAGALTGKEDNATAFGKKDATNKSKAVQNFYLKEATAIVYKGVTGKDAKKDVEDASKNIGLGADYYKLTEIQKGGASITAQADATAAAASQDIYIVASAPADGTPAAITKVEKGGTAPSSGIGKVYSIESTPVADVSAVTDSDLFLYIDSATAPAAGDEAAFRYVGALSQAKSGWSSTDDLKGIKIKYDISAISETAYKAVAKDDGSGLTYGYKAESSKISITSTGEMTVQGLSGTVYKSGSLTLAGTEYPLDSKAGNWQSTTEPAVWKFSSTWTNNIKGKEVTVKIVLQDNTTIEETLTVPAS